MPVNSHANDAMIRRLESELEERNAYVQGMIANAQDGERDLNDTEKSSLAETRSRMGELKSQIDELEETARIATDIASRAKQVDQAITTARRNYEAGPVEYRSTGAYLVDYIAASDRFTAGDGTPRTVHPCRRASEDDGQPGCHPGPDHSAM